MQAGKQLELSGAREAESHADSLFDIVGNKHTRVWRTFIEFKLQYYSSLVALHQGLASEEAGSWGERVAFYQAAATSLGQAAAIVKEDRLEQLFPGVREAVVYTNDVIAGKLDNAKKENEFIYHCKVPEQEDLPAVQPASLVRGIPFDPQDPEVSGGDLLAGIVTLETHLAASAYSEELAQLLRTVTGEVERANDSLVLYLSSLQLEDIPDSSSTASLPQEVVDCAAGLSVRPQCVAQLQEGMGRLAGVSAEVEASLQETQALLKEEEGRQAEWAALVGATQPRPVMAELERETQKYHQVCSLK